MRTSNIKSQKDEQAIVVNAMETTKYIEQRMVEDLGNILKDVSSFYREVFPVYYKDGQLDQVEYERLVQSFKSGRINTDISRMIDTVEKEVEKIQSKVLDTWLPYEYKWVADRTATSLRSRDNPMPRSTKLSNRGVKRQVRKSWCSDGLTYLDRIYRNSMNMKEKLQIVFIQGMRHGWIPTKMDKKFKDIVGVATTKAIRLLRTETMAIYSKATKETFLNNGIEYITIMGDALCGEVCTEYVGESVPLQEAEIGIELPPYHPNCACYYCVDTK